MQHEGLIPFKARGRLAPDGTVAQVPELSKLHVSI